ncbi:unnamed protein product, partial [Ectocarpus sp. 8 AP-2014]
MAAAPSSSPRQAMDISNTLDAAAALGLADDEAVKSRILGYVDLIEGMQLSSAAEVEDAKTAERLC